MVWGRGSARGLALGLFIFDVKSKKSGWMPNSKYREPADWTIPGEKRTALPGKVELLQSVDFYGILTCRKGAVLQVQRSCFPPRCHCSCHRQEEVQFFVILLTVRLFLHEILEGGFHHGNFKYCFFRTEPFGYSRHRRHQCDVDDFEGRLSGQTSGKTLFEKIMTRKMTAPSIPNFGGHVF